MEFFYQTLNNLGYTHPIHPTMVYLPIGCVMAAFIFGITAMLFNHPSLFISAKHCIILAFIAVFPTIIFGYMDWQHFHGGNLIFPIKMKMILAAVLIVLLSISVVSNWKFRVTKKVILALYALCFFNVITIGYYGGEIVFAAIGKKNRVSGTAGEAIVRQPGETITYAEVSGIFNQNCILCHKGPKAPIGLQLDTYEHVMAGSEYGRVIVPGKPADSELIHRLRGLSLPAMPYMREPLPENKIEMLARWIQQGAKKSDITQHQGE